MDSEENTRSIASNDNVSKQLLYSEYVNSTAAEHVVQLIQRKSLEKPVMQFKKSVVLDRVKKFLPLLEQSQKDLSKKNPEEYNIEKLRENESFVEMDVAVMEELDEDHDKELLHSELENTEEMESKNLNPSCDEFSNNSYLDTEDDDSDESSDYKNSVLNVLELDDTDDSVDESVHKIIFKENAILNDSTCMQGSSTKNNIFEDERPLKKLRT